MKELRPLGSEKLTGDAKIQRILEIANYGRTPKPSVTVDKPEYITESKIGGVYGIVKEKDGFYVKKGLNESSLEYIGGMFMKNKNKFSSYGEAFKRLDFLKGQETLQEATKYILKQTKTPEAPPMEAAPEEPAMNELPPMGDTPAPEGDTPMGGEGGMSPEGEPSPEGGEGQLRSSYMANIQKFAGKLGQELRDQKDKLESDDLKYTLNMVISAVDLDKLDDKDFEEIADKFDPEKRDGEVGDMPPMGDESAPEPESVPEPEQEVAEENYSTNYGEEEDIDEVMSKLDEFINSPVGEEDSTDSMFRQYSNLGKDDETDLNELDTEFDNQFGDEEVNLDELDNEFGEEPGIIDWEQKLRGKSEETHIPSHKPQLDIDEIAKAINSALSKYR